MEPITGLSLILSLIPLYQRERDKTKQANQEEFYSWLLNHKFQEVKDCITSNFALSAEIEQILKMNQDELLTKLEALDKNMFCIMNSMQEFRSLIKIVAPTSSLTEQEESILKQFVKSNSSIITVLYFTGDQILHVDKGGSIEIKDNRFISSNLQRLVSMGFLLQKSKDCYNITEMAVEYINNLEKNDLSDQAKSILKQYVESKQQYLCTILDGQGAVSLSAQNIGIHTANTRFITDDLDALLKKGFIAFDGDMSLGGKKYTLTRAGEEYVVKLCRTNT